MDPQLQQATLQLADSVVRNTAGAVFDRIRASKAKKDDAETIKELDQIINELIEDKNELVRIAGVYKEVLVAQTISNDDIQFITDTVVPFIEHVAGDSLDGETLAQIKSLISADAVQILQILGFDFRKALGEPLTELTRSAILAKKAPPDAASERERLSLEREVIMAKLAADPEAFSRLMRIYGRE